MKDFNILVLLPETLDEDVKQEYRKRIQSINDGDSFSLVTPIGFEFQILKVKKGNVCIFNIIPSEYLEKGTTLPLFIKRPMQDITKRVSGGEGGVYFLAEEFLEQVEITII